MRKYDHDYGSLLRYMDTVVVYKDEELLPMIDEWQRGINQQENGEKIFGSVVRLMYQILGHRTVDDFHECTATFFSRFLVKFDPTRGMKFSTYIRNCTQNKIKDIVRAKYALKFRCDLTGQADFDTLVTRYSDKRFGRPVANANHACEFQRVYNIVLTAFAKMGVSGRDRTIFKMATFEGETHIEIGKKLNLTRQRVHQIYQECMSKIRGWDALTGHKLYPLSGEE